MGRLPIHILLQTTGQGFRKHKVTQDFLAVQMLLECYPEGAWHTVEETSLRIMFDGELPLQQTDVWSPLSRAQAIAANDASLLEAIDKALERVAFQALSKRWRN